MKELDDGTIEAEIDEITKRIDTIMGKVETLDVVQNDAAQPEKE